MYVLPKPDAPKGTSGRWITAGLILLMLATWMAVYSSIVIERELPENNVTNLDPGHHFIGKVPFYINVPPHNYAILTERSWYYDTRVQPQVVIPKDHVGVLTRDDGVVVRPDTLEPGIYKINLAEYTVTLFKTKPQTYMFGGNGKAKEKK